MQIDKIKYTEELNVKGLSRWVGLEATLSEGDNEQDCLKVLQGSVRSFIKETTQEDIKAVKEPELSPEYLTQRELLVKDLNEAADVKTITVIHNEAPKEMRADSMFIDAVLKNKIRVTGVKVAENE